MYYHANDENESLINICDTCDHYKHSSNKCTNPAFLKMIGSTKSRLTGRTGELICPLYTCTNT